MVKLIKKAGMQANEQSKPMNILIGTVKQVGPLIINVEQRQDIPAEFLYLTDEVRDHETEILMDCDDSWGGEADHPSGDEEVCYRVSYDLDPYDLTAQYCPEALETEDELYDQNDGQLCCVDAPEKIIFVE